MGKLDGKIALVTGASKGIGAGIALSLAKEGAAVAVNHASDRKGADRVVERIKAAGGKAIAVQGSVTSSEEIDRFFSETEKQRGNVDVLVNNAGVFAYLPLQDVNEKEFHRQFDTNVLGLLLTSKRAANQFGEKGGCIINIGSVARHRTTRSCTTAARMIFHSTKSSGSRFERGDDTNVRKLSGSRNCGDARALSNLSWNRIFKVPRRWRRWQCTEKLCFAIEIRR